MKHALVCGAGGFIGSHLVKRLKNEGYWVRGVDLKRPEFSPTAADEFLILDLREPENCRRAVTNPGSGKFDEVTSLPPTWAAWDSSIPPSARSCATAP